MKKIVDGKVYNTQTAKLIGEWDNGYSYSDFNWACEILYQTKKGQYFLYGEGGPMSSYAEWCGNSASGGEEIQLLSEAQALDWCSEKNIDPDFVSGLFELEEG